MRISLRARFILVISTVLLVLFGIIAYFLIRNERVTLANDLNSSSKAFAQLATRPIGDAYNVYQAAGFARIQQETVKFTDLDPNVAAVAIVGLDGQTLLDIKGHLTGVSADTAMSFDTVYQTNANKVYTQIVEPYLDTFGQHKFAVAYRFSTNDLEASASRDALTILIFALVGLLISAFVTYELLNVFFLRPIEDVSRMSVIVGNGDYAQQISVKRNDEIGDLARSVNQMANALKDNILKLQEVDKLKNEFIMIASHNLRTPLTIIKGYLDALHDTKMSDETREMITAIETSALSLSSFSEDMLTISTIEAGNTHPVAPNPSTIEEIVSPLRDNFALLGEQKKVSVIWDIPKTDEPILLSAWHVRNALSNIVANAIKFNHDGGQVSITFAVNGNDYVFTVVDTGIGIADEEIPKLFTKFHRGTSTLQYNYEGTGIGLYASKLLVETQGGHITAESAPGKGSTFTITLPKLELAPPPSGAQSIL